MLTKSQDPIAPFKEQAKRLRTFVSNGGHDMKHSHALEAVATMHGFKDFHTLAASKQVHAATPERRGSSSGAVASLFDDLVAHKHAPNFTATSIAAWEGLLAAQRETRPETEHNDPVYWSAADDERLVAARLTLNPFDCFGMHRALAYVGNGHDVSIYAERALDYIDEIREYLDLCKTKGEDVPGIDWVDFREKIQLDLAQACTAAYAAFYAWAEKQPIEMVARLFSEAGGLCSDPSLDLEHFSNGEELARCLCLLEGDLKEALQYAGNGEDFIDSCLPILSALDDGIATPIIQPDLNKSLTMVVWQIDMEKKDAADPAMSAVQRDDDLLDRHFDCYAGEWIYVDHNLALMAFLRKRPDILEKLRSVLL